VARNWEEEQTPADHRAPGLPRHPDERPIERYGRHTRNLTVVFLGLTTILIVLAVVAIVYLHTIAGPVPR
jgi:hypothetical protein